MLDLHNGLTLVQSLGGCPTYALWCSGGQRSNLHHKTTEVAALDDTHNRGTTVNFKGVPFAPKHLCLTTHLKACWSVPWKTSCNVFHGCRSDAGGCSGHRRRRTCTRNTVVAHQDLMVQHRSLSLTNIVHNSTKFLE